MHAAAPSPGVPALPQSHLSQHGQALGPAFDRRQLRHPQAPHGQGWLARHKRVHLHFTPTSASWLNQVERFFGLITQDAIRRGVFRSVTELKTAIEAYLENHNADSNPSF